MKEIQLLLPGREFLLWHAGCLTPDNLPLVRYIVCSITLYPPLFECEVDVAFENCTSLRVSSTTATGYYFSF